MKKRNHEYDWSLLDYVNQQNYKDFGWLRVNLYNLLMIFGRSGKGFMRKLIYFFRYGFKIRHKTKEGLIKII